MIRFVVEIAGWLVLVVALFGMLFGEMSGGASAVAQLAPQEVFDTDDDYECGGSSIQCPKCSGTPRYDTATSNWVVDDPQNGCSRPTLTLGTACQGHNDSSCVWSNMMCGVVTTPYVAPGPNGTMVIACQNSLYAACSNPTNSRCFLL